jgi:hypothetical protein
MRDVCGENITSHVSCDVKRSFQILIKKNYSLRPEMLANISSQDEVSEVKRRRMYPYWTDRFFFHHARMPQLDG